MSVRAQDRREFGRRWSHVHGWITVEGRPRLPCHVRNFSEGGALIVVEQALTLPYTFRLEIESIKLRIGCQTRHRHHNRVGVRFISPDLVSEIGPVWNIDDLMAGAGHMPERMAG
jgi:hypothetical protein